jgi:O-antigen/teichoic acid export membrane protein
MKKNYFYNLLLSITNILFPILSFPYASRILGPEGIGKVQMSSTLAQYFGLIAALGIPIYGMQEIARVRQDKKAMSKVFTELFSIYFICSVFVAIVYLIVISYFPYFKESYTLFLYAGVIILFGFTTVDWFYAGLEEFKIIAIRSITIKVIALLLLYYLVRTPSDYLYFLFITLFSMMGNNLIGVYFLHQRTHLTLKGLDLKKHLSPLFFIFSTTIAASMYTYLDTVLLGFLSNNHAVGLYTASVKLTKIAIPFITAASFVLIPKLAIHTQQNNQKAQQELLHRSWHYIVFFSIPISVGLLVNAREFMMVFSGAQFESAITAMQIMAFLPFFIGLGYFFAFQILVPMGKSKEMLYAVLIGMVASLLMNFILIPYWQEKGAAIANLITEVLVSAVYLFFIQKTVSFKYNWHLIVRSLVCCVLFYPIILMLRQIQTPYILVLFASIFLSAISYFSMQYLLFKDLFLLEVVKEVMHKIKPNKGS